MIQVFIDAFLDRKNELAAIYSEKHPEDYKEIVFNVVKLLSNVKDGYNSMDATRIHEIDDGDYQGTLMYVIAAEGYQPDDYWFVKVGYGSCSACDTLQDIQSRTPYGDRPTAEQIKDYITLSPHVVEGLKSMQTER
jgi:hypothetical protein